MELSKTFEPKAAEERWAAVWEARGYFVADPSKDGSARNPLTDDDYFSVVIPPPNVTGQLHLGHALNATLQDVIVRARRMQGFNTLWLVGTDHAGIATQNVVERELANEHRTRHDLGRQAFVARVWRWRETYGRRIIDQLRRLGSSCDFSRERFTLDPGLSRGVIAVFVRLYKDGLIYRERRLINWCPRCETALSDLEVEHREVPPAKAPPLDNADAWSDGPLPNGGLLFYIEYPLANGRGALSVATTRPETMLGDTALAVNPNDERYRALVGQRATLPLVGRELKIIADEAVEAEFGTGVVKITPAHDFADFTIGRRHALEELAVIDTRGRMTEQAGPYQGLSREQARGRVLADLLRGGLLKKVEPHRQVLAICSRCETVLEPTLSWQWFVKVKPLAERALAAVRQGRTRFHPKHWENTYFRWLEDVHDWCISRQLWWGHRIPAYWCARCGWLMVEESKPAKCARCGAGELNQEQDVLDTWFSSALWPFSTLGWPEDAAEFKRYYPTSLLVTGFDIIFFWVARMMMMGLYCTRDVPFREVYITPLVRDQYGKKMTKSRGNVVDPLAIMDTYGTDAVRFTLAQLAVQGRDLVLSGERLAASKAFANKIWNAARFVLMNLADAPKPVPAIEAAEVDLPARWVLDELNSAIAEVSGFIDGYQFNSAALAVYDFAWHRLCDWYVELAKEPLKQGGAARAGAQFVLVRCLDSLLRLLHPFMPFLTEELWQALRPYVSEPDLAPHLAVAAFPKSLTGALLTSSEKQAMEHCIEATQAINSLRALLEFHPGQRVRAFLAPRLTDAGSAAHQHRELLEDFALWQPYARMMTKTESLTVEAAESLFGPRCVKTVLPWCEVLVEAPAGFDFEKAHSVLEKKLAAAQGHLQQHQARLANADFATKADEETRERTQQRTEQLHDEILRLRAHLRSLESRGGSSSIDEG